MKYSFIWPSGDLAVFVAVGILMAKALSHFMGLRIIRGSLPRCAQS